MRSKSVSMLVAALLLAHSVSLLSATFTVTNTADAGPGTLRQAILDANANPGLDTIAFNIPGSGVQTIAPTSALPSISDPVIIDGYTQPGASPNTLANGDDAVLLIELDGAGAGANSDGLTIAGGNSTIRGLIVNRFATGNAIVLTNGPNNLVAGNFIGVDAAGKAPLKNFRGIEIMDSSFNLVGGQTPDNRNVISGNYGSILVTHDPNNPLAQNANSNVICGNFIGTDATGLAAASNDPTLASAITIFYPTNCVVGGATPGAGNVISGNPGGAFYIYGDRTQIMGNLIGVAADGISALGNGRMSGQRDAGVHFDYSSYCQVGGLLPGAGNIIAYTTGPAVWGNGSSISILGNSIFANAGLGIDLALAGVTPNDHGDTDGVQNFPVLTSLLTASNVIVSGTLNSVSYRNYAIQVFSNRNPDPSGYGQGEVLLATTTVTTDGSGNAAFSLPFDLSVLWRPWFTATATSPDGSTSEFSKAVPPYPVIVVQPTNRYSTLGSNATFSVTAEGMGPLTYHWRLNGTDIAGATNVTLVLTNIQLADGGTYSVVVSNSVGTAESNGALLGLKPVILQQPRSQTAVQGDTVVLKVNAVGFPAAKYLWRFNSSFLAAQTNAVLVLNNVQSTNVGTYRVYVLNDAGTTVSSSAVLAVLADSDGDHMPDVWELANGFNPNDPSDASLDPDGDGFTNLQEYIGGTDPHDAHSFLKLNQVLAGSGAAVISFSAVSNKTYSVLYKDALDSSGWLKLADFLAPTTNSIAAVSDPNPPRQRFYRLVTPQQP